MTPSPTIEELLETVKALRARAEAAEQERDRALAKAAEAEEEIGEVRFKFSLHESWVRNPPPKPKPKRVYWVVGHRKPVEIQYKSARTARKRGSGPITKVSVYSARELREWERRRELRIRDEEWRRTNEMDQPRHYMQEMAPPAATVLKAKHSNGCYVTMRARTGRALIGEHAQEIACDCGQTIQAMAYREQHARDVAIVEAMNDESIAIAILTTINRESAGKAVRAAILLALKGDT